MQRVKHLGGLPKCVEEPEGVFGRAKMTTAAMETGAKGRPSGVRHTDCTLTRALRARFTFSRMSEAEAVQMKGLGRSL